MSPENPNVISLLPTAKIFFNHMHRMIPVVHFDEAELGYTACDQQGKYQILWTKWTEANAQFHNVKCSL